MADRDLSAPVTVDLKPVDEGQSTLGGIASGLASAGEKIYQTSQQAKINENVASAQLDLAKLDSQYRIKAQADPFNSDMQQDYQNQRSAVLANYKSQISPLYGMDWNEAALKLTSNSDLQNEAWQYKQAASNTTQSLQNSMTSNFRQANQSGQNFGVGDGTNDESHLMDFKLSHDQLASFAQQNLGQQSSDELLRNYQKDYMKSFIMGAAETNPQKANDLLNRPDVNGLFTSQETTEMQQVMRRQIKAKSIDQLTQSANAGQAASDVVYGNGSYQDKRLKIDQMELSGSLPSNVAENSRRVLKSSEAVAAQTDSNTMGQIITQVYDLNAVQDTNSEDYLNGVKNIQADILSKQAAGKLSAEDAQKLSKQVTSLSSQKMAQATQRVGINFYDAKEQFNVLPPQYRGEAIRQLFYRTQGQDSNPGVMNTTAKSIIDEINNRSRQQTVSTLQGLNQPSATFTPTGGVPQVLQPPLSFDKAQFMKDNNISQQAVTSTAQKYNIPEDEVVRRLYNAKNPGK